MDHRTVRLVALALALVVGVASCSTTGGGSAAEPGTTAPAVTTAATFTAHGSLGQAYVVGAAPGAQLVLADAAGEQVGAGTADTLGSLIVRDVPPGDGYTFRSVDGTTVAGSAPFKVLALTDAPPQSFYANQQLKAGLNYITMRDGVSLAATVRPPEGKTLADGPFPTVIEYSGYAVAPPHDPIDAALHHTTDEDDPLVPDVATAVGGILAPLMGFATVSLQMRGSGCSGGAMGLFDLPTTSDGYDAVEIAAAQPWVKGGRVGMVGISFSGISQLFVAGAQPPHLAAIAPLSVTDDLYSTGLPGGIYNDGFAASWLADRVHDAQPAPQGGQPWAKALIDSGDQQCKANQALRLQTQDVGSLLKDDPTRDPALYDVRSPAKSASKITVPVFLVGALQDEQTGGQWPRLVPALASDKDVWVTMINGTHIDSLGPATLSRWLEFLDLFVADEVPKPEPALANVSTQLYEQAADMTGQPVPAVRFTDAPDLDAARADFREDPRIRVLMDNGGTPSAPGSLGPMWETSFTAWPPPPDAASTYYLSGNGRLATAAPAPASVSFTPDPAARPRNSLPKGNAWDALPAYQWAPVTGGTGLGFISDPLPNDLAVIGPASLDLSLQSTAPDTDLQVAVSEVRPDGQEMYVQSGFLRASARALDTSASTALEPVPTYVAADRHPLPAGTTSLVRIPILPINYVFRAGSKIRISITAPGGDRPAWEFDTPQTGGTVTDTLALGGAQASALVLPVVPGVSAPDPQPACPSLRGQPCRSYAAAGNGG
jgi:predicted acyl esterase